ncbi:DNA polymerase phi-domain-containing protein [Schizophyllum amplum]|uniref:DNA polymerase phi-domain-containing protein n=1 Tax=Schizophyllum amplum TaxID=97359 RepID=A0A550CAL6_9AGAR|nr:DNA polymerase phi-domain-containing protein [Auriculariopsis ampla]
MSTTLPLFWRLSSASKKERLDASVKLIDALEKFQAQHTVTVKDAGVSSEEPSDDEEDADESDGLDALNAQDVSYSIRRLVRGLASPRESSRLGFAVALTELLSRIDTVTCAQITALIMDSSKPQGSVSGQEERDLLFARLFGFTSVIQSGLLTRTKPLPSSASASVVSSLESYQEVLLALFELGEKKAWLRESAWWTIGMALDALKTSEVAWQEEARDWTIGQVYAEREDWSPEKVAITLKLQRLYPTVSWKKHLSPVFKNPDLLNNTNLPVIARIIKDTRDEEDEDEVPKSQAGNWKPQLHFVWDLMLAELLPTDGSHATSSGSFQEFFRVVVDDSLFSATASPHRKYWGFQVFQKALPRVDANTMPMLFTRNLMRSWINHLSHKDRYLHKIALQVATDVQSFVKSNPHLGFALILQLTGVNGSTQFDKLTHTKTVETILTSMDEAGIKTYIDHLLEQVNSSDKTDVQAINSTRAWIIEQLTSLIRNGAIPKQESWIQTILDWFTIHGLFTIKKKSEKSAFLALHTVPSPPFSDALRKSCRERLMTCLADLTSQTITVKTEDGKTSKLSGTTSDGEFLIVRILGHIATLEQDTKHLASLADGDDEEQQLRTKAKEIMGKLQKLEDNDAAKGAQLLLAVTLLQRYCSVDGGASADEDNDDEQVADTDDLETSANSDEPPAVDVLVDTIIGFLEKGNAYLRACGNKAFALLTGVVQESTVDLILTQLERRDPTAGDDDDDEMEVDEEGEGEDEEEEEEESEEDEEDDDSDEGEDDAETLELRNKIEEALRVNGIEPANEDDDPASGKKKADVDAQREATHFKNRVLDLVDVFFRQQSTSPLVIRLLLPLSDLIVSSGPDEQQLADKAKGIIRARIGKAKDTPSSPDVDAVKTALADVHSRARRVRSPDHLSTLSIVSMYLAKTALHMGAEDAVVETYKESLTDFLTRKNSSLNTSFFQEIIRRHVAVGWRLRTETLELSSQAVNAYRRCQAYQLVQTLLNQMPSLTLAHDDVAAFMDLLQNSLSETISGACDGTINITATQLKELLKLAHSAARQSQKLPASVKTVWSPSTWTQLSARLTASDKFKASTGLHKACQQIAQLTGGAATQSSATKITPASTSAPIVNGVDKKAKSSKRKAEEAAGSEKPKRKKGKKDKPNVD